MVVYSLRDMLPHALSTVGRFTVTVALQGGSKLRRAGDYATVLAELERLDRSIRPGQVAGVRVHRMP